MVLFKFQENEVDNNEGMKVLQLSMKVFQMKI